MKPAYAWPLLMLVWSLASPWVHSHENHQPPPSAQSLGPLKGKTVRVTQEQIDLLLAAQPEGTKADEASKLQTRAEVREVLLQRALLERGALEAGLDRDPQVQQQLQAARQAVLANAYSKRLADPRSVSVKDIDAEYQRAKVDLSDTEYEMRRLAFVDQAKAQELVQELTRPSLLNRLKSFLGFQSAAQNLGEWRWIASRRMPPPVLDEVRRLHQDPTAQPKPVRVEGTWYVVQVKDKRSASYPEKSEVESSLRSKLAQQHIQLWLSERRKAEGLDLVSTVPTERR